MSASFRTFIAAVKNTRFTTPSGHGSRASLFELQLVMKVVIFSFEGPLFNGGLQVVMVLGPAYS